MKEDESVLLKTYIQEWTKFFAQCQYIAQPFKSLETHSAKNNSGKKANKPIISESSSIKKVCNDSNMFFIEVSTLIDAVLLQEEKTSKLQ